MDNIREKKSTQEKVLKLAKFELDIILKDIQKREKRNWLKTCTKF